MVAPKAGHKKTEQARRRGDPVSSPPPHALTLRISAPVYMRVSLLLQDHKVFAQHEKFGMFQVPKEFLNTNKKAPAAVAPKEKVHSRRVGHAYPWHDTRDAARTTRVRKMDVLSDKLYTSLPLHLSYIIHVSIVTRSRRHLVRAQVNKADGHTNEQQTQQKQEKTRNQQKQKQQKQTGGGKNCVSSLSPCPAGTASADGIEARIPVI